MVQKKLYRENLKRLSYKKDVGGKHTEIITLTENREEGEKGESVGRIEKRKCWE